MDNDWLSDWLAGWLSWLGNWLASSDGKYYWRYANAAESGDLSQINCAQTELLYWLQIREGSVRFQGMHAAACHCLSPTTPSPHRSESAAAPLSPRQQVAARLCIYRYQFNYQINWQFIDFDGELIEVLIRRTKRIGHFLCNRVPWLSQCTC